MKLSVSTQSLIDDVKRSAEILCTKRNFDSEYVLTNSHLQSLDLGGDHTFVDVNKT